MNQQEQDECFNALVFSLTALIRSLDAGTLDGRRMIGVIENTAEALLELKTADNLNRSVIALQEKIIALNRDKFEILRDRLGVPVEPHQTLFERMLIKAGDIQGVFLKGYAAALCVKQ
jgi:hypothetical protein